MYITDEFLEQEIEPDIKPERAKSQPFYPIPEGYEATDKPPRACIACLGTGYQDLDESNGDCYTCKGTGVEIKAVSNG